MISLIIISCHGLPCGEAVSMDEAIIRVIGEDTTGCHGVKVDKELSACASLTDLVTCGNKPTLAEAFQSAINDDGCSTGFMFRIFDVTAR